MRCGRRRSMTMLVQALHMPQLAATSPAGVDRAAQEPSYHPGAFEQRMSATADLVQQVRALGSQQSAQLLEHALTCDRGKTRRAEDSAEPRKHAGSAAQQHAGVTGSSRAVSHAVRPETVQHATQSKFIGTQQDSMPRKWPAQTVTAAEPAIADSKRILSMLHLVLSTLEEQNRMLQQGRAQLQKSDAAADIARVAARSCRGAGGLRHGGSLQHARMSSCGRDTLAADMLRWGAQAMRHKPKGVGPRSHFTAHTAQHLPRQRLQPEWDDSLAGQAPRNLQDSAAKLKPAGPMRRRELSIRSPVHQSASRRNSMVLRHVHASRQRRQLGAHNQWPKRAPASALSDSAHDGVCPTCVAALAAKGLVAGWCTCDGRV